MSMSEQRPRSISSTLLVRVKSFDEAAWRRMVDLFGPVVRRWCIGWGAPPSEADDIAQETFLKVARAIGGFRRDRPGDTFRGWLHAVARDRMRDHYRRQDRLPPQAGAEALEQLEAPGTSFTEDEIGLIYERAVANIVDQFAPRVFEAFRLTALERRPAAEVARELGMTVPAVYQARHRVYHRIREELHDLLD